MFSASTPREKCTLQAAPNPSASAVVTLMHDVLRGHRRADDLSAHPYRDPHPLSVRAWPVASTITPG
jgi:hypothetical protein